MSAEPAGADDDGPEWASGLLPPDGAAWPPAPVPVAPQPTVADALPTTPRRPDDSHIADWRSLPVDSPGGYRGSGSAPPTPEPRVEPWSVAAISCAVVALAAYLGVSVLGAGVLLMPFLAIAFGITGRKACTLDPTLRGTAVATAAVVLGVAELIAPFAFAGTFGLFD
ncbi:MAG: hypothetical protein ABMA25_22785 [Ilumatobacteraceae bacterium]